MRNLFSIIFICILTSSLNAQKEITPKFGKIEIEDFKQTVYNIDTSAEAIIIYETGVHSAALPDVSYYDYYCRIKILKSPGRKYSKIAIPYVIYSDNQKLKVNISANSYTLENGIIKTSKMDENKVSNVLTSIYNGVIKFEIPNVKAGSIIEYKYTLSSLVDFTISDGWYFQHEIPTLISEYSNYNNYGLASIPMFNGNKEKLIISDKRYTPQRNVFATSSPLKQQVENISVYKMKDIEAIRQEKYSNPNNFAYRLFFLSSNLFKKKNGISNKFKNVGTEYIPMSTSWHEIGEFQSNCEVISGFIKSKEVKTAFKNVNFKLKRNDDTISKIYNYIGENFKLDKGVSLSINRTPKNVISSRIGKTSDLNLLLIGFLQLAGVKAYPAISTNAPYLPLDPSIPRLTSNRKIICVVKLSDGNNYIIDMLGYPGSPGLLPIEDLNGQAFVIYDDKNFGWVTLKSFENSVTWNKVNLVLANDSLQATIESDHKGYAAKDHSDRLASDKDKYLEKEFGEFNKRANSLDFKVSLSPSINASNYKANTIIRFNGHLYTSQDTLFIDPLLSFGLQENPFINSIRYYPVDFKYPSDEIYQLSFQIPKGYQITKLPASLNLKNSDNTLKFLYAWENIGDRVNLIYKLNIKKAVFELEEYPEVRHIYNMIYGKCRENLILIKSLE